MKSWIDQLKPLIEEYKHGSGSDPLSSKEVERLALIIRLQIDREEGNITDEAYEKAFDYHSTLSTLYH